MLAQRSAASAKEIRGLIGDSNAQIASSVAAIRTAGTDMADIADGFGTLASRMSDISDSSARQSQGLAEITVSVRQLDQITQRNAQMVEHAVHASASLEERARTLAGAVAAFQLQQGTAEEAMALVGRAIELHDRCPPHTFLSTLTDPAQPYHDRDMYVFVLDTSGTYRAFGGNPAKMRHPGARHSGRGRGRPAARHPHPGRCGPGLGRVRHHQPAARHGADQDVVRAGYRRPVCGLRGVQAAGAGGLRPGGSWVGHCGSSRRRRATLHGAGSAMRAVELPFRRRWVHGSPAVRWRTVCPRVRQAEGFAGGDGGCRNARARASAAATAARRASSCVLSGA